MTIPRLCALATAVLVIFSGCACHAQKITVDPNSGAAAKPIDDKDLDSRLAQKVTLEAWHKPVKDILADLSKSTGVILNAGASKDNWQVRDRKMNICVKDISLAQLMTSIARVMKFKWTKNSDLDPPTYRLLTDYRLLAKLQAEASRRENELKREEMKRRTELLEALAKAANTSGSELSALKESNPYLYLCAETGFAKLVTQLFAEEPKLGEMFVQAEKNLQPEIGALSPSTQQLCAEVMRKFWPITRKKGDNTGAIPDYLEEKIQDFPLIMRSISSAFESSQRQRLYDFGSIATFIPRPDGYHVMGVLRDPSAKSTQAWARALFAISDDAATESSIGQAYTDRYKTEQEEARSSEYYLMYDLPVEHPDEASLHEKVTVKLSKEAIKALQEEANVSGAYDRLMYQAVLKALAEDAKVNVISDSYAVIQEANPQISEKEELGIVLDALCDAYRCNWEKYGTTIEIRRMDWFRRRSSQVPDEWLQPYRDELEKEGILNLLNFARMMTLSEEQLEENISNDALLSKAVGMSWEYASARGLLRFYVQLTDSQRDLIFTERGLDPRSLNATQWQCYTEMFHYGRRYAWATEEFSDPGAAPIVIKATSELNKSGGVWYKFSVYLTKEDGSIKENPCGVTVSRVAPPKDKAGQAVGSRP